MMIARYSTAEMNALWSEEAKLARWLRVEMAVCIRLARDGVIPPGDWRELSRKLKDIQKRGLLKPARVLEIEAVVRHDVIAFTTAVAELVGPSARWVHYGLTSSDVLDTAAALAWRESGALLLEEIDALIAVLAKRAREFAGLPAIGRSHGMFAEPTSFGLKFLGWHEEWKRARRRVERALEGMRFGKLSGAVGAGSYFSPKHEAEILLELGLQREPVSTQVIPRDRHAELFCALAIAGASMERVAVELRHLQRSEVAEVREAFQKGQKGSSAMPHKRNPISAENLTGLARLLRSYAQAALENVALWHERDISHSSVERVIGPDALTLAHYGVRRLRQLVAGLEVDRKRVAANLASAGPIAGSGKLLLALTRAGVSREEAYTWIQACAHQATNAADFARSVEAHPEIARRLKPQAVRSALDSKAALKNVDAIFKEALKKEITKKR